MKCPQCTAGDCLFSEAKECWVCLFCDWVDGRGKKGGTQRGGIKRNLTTRETWRISCMDRDGYACVMCGRSNCELNVRHIAEDEGDTLDNGITLCAGKDKNNCYSRAEQLHPGYTQEELRARRTARGSLGDRYQFQRDDDNE